MSFQLLLALSYCILPVLIIILTNKSKLANRIGAILIAYLAGLLIGNTGLFPHPGDYLNQYLTIHPGASISDIQLLLHKGLIPENDLLAFKIRALQDLLLTITIPLALPLMLFTMNVHLWFRMAGKTMLSMILAFAAIIVVVLINLYVFRNSVANLSKISGMLVGLYTGGTPNLAALKMMLNVDADTYIKVHTYDMIPSLAYLFFIITIGKSLFRKWLPKYPFKADSINGNGKQKEEKAFAGFFKRNVFLRTMVAFFLAIVIFALAGSTTLFIPKENQMLVVILIITTLSIAASLIPRVNQIEHSFELGMYFILVFSVVVASMADIQRLAQISGSLFLLITATIFSSLLLHLILSKIFKVDADTLMVTSTALICSPPFVPMIAGALKNREIVVSGLTVGIIGYALGNYLGVLIAYLFSF